MKTKLLKFSALFAILCLVACTVNEISVALDVAAMAVEVASGTIGSVTSIPPATAADIVAGLNAADTALTTAARDLQSGSISAEQIASISEALAAAVLQLNSVSNSLPPIAKVAIEAVISGVQAFLTLWEGEKANLKVAGLGPYRVHLTWQDKRNIEAGLKSLQNARDNLLKLKK